MAYDLKVVRDKPNHYRVELRYGGEVVGRLQANLFTDKLQTYDVFIDKIHRGQNLSVKMYQALFQKAKNLGVGAVESSRHRLPGGEGSWEAVARVDPSIKYSEKRDVFRKSMQMKAKDEVHPVGKANDLQQKGTYSIELTSGDLHFDTLEEAKRQAKNLARASQKPITIIKVHPVGKANDLQPTVYKYADKPKKPAPILSVADPVERKQMAAAKLKDEVMPVGDEDTTELDKKVRAARQAFYAAKGKERGKKHDELLELEAELRKAKAQDVMPVGDAEYTVGDKVLYGNRPCTVLHVYSDTLDLKTTDGYKQLGVAVSKVKAMGVAPVGDSEKPFDRDSDVGSALQVLRDKIAGLTALQTAKKYGYTLEFVNDVRLGKFGKTEVAIKKAFKTDDVMPVGDADGKRKYRVQYTLANGQPGYTEIKAASAEEAKQTVMASKPSSTFETVSAI